MVSNPPESVLNGAYVGRTLHTSNFASTWNWTVVGIL